jgi:prevent-host-death family protein
MTVVTVHRAKTELSKLLKRVEAGEEIIIARGGKEVAKLVPAQKAAAKSRGWGALKHLNLQIPDSFFFDPLPDDELDAWEGKYGSDP